MLSPKQIWQMSRWVNLSAKRAMDHRASQEYQEVREYQRELEKVHGQAIRDYEIFLRLIEGSFDFIQRVGMSLDSNMVAVDVGSGTGVGAAILSRFPFVRKVYAVEFSELFVDHIMPLTFEKFGAEQGKIVRVVGDFNHLKLPDGGVDIILDIDSFHHSENLDVTLEECYRVLKPQGMIIAIDRGWPDFYTQEQLERMLDVELNENLKRKYGIPPGESFTRRDFGEHEYTIQQWEQFFSMAGFDTHVFVQRHPPVLNRIWLRLPTFEMSIQASAFMAKRGKHRHILYGWGETRILIVAIKK